MRPRTPTAPLYALALSTIGLLLASGCAPLSATIDARTGTTLAERCRVYADAVVAADAGLKLAVALGAKAAAAGQVYNDAVGRLVDAGCGPAL
ncbi:MAG: hypothetical protein GC168_20560 [Candidatus Hydrogenedens sp.]|nr:hypothetical protein [Candidatus Hydrogenedens sp.]